MLGSHKKYIGQRGLSHVEIMGNHQNQPYCFETLEETPNEGD